MQRTRLIAVRAPTESEVVTGRAGGAMVAFERQAGDGPILVVFASPCYGSYQQWGDVPLSVLGDNVEAATLWAEGLAAVEALIREEPDDEGEEENDES